MNYLIIGGAGFIGSHIVKKILEEDSKAKVTVYDNFSSGKKEHFGEAINNERLVIHKEEISNDKALFEAMQGQDIVYSVASNPDIAKAVSQPDIDFWEGTFLINNVLEAMRKAGVINLLYASGSGVYGDVGENVTAETYSPLLPTSTYGASKLACEALICSYCHMFDMNAASFRFANVVGDNQTHGVGYDFINRLLDDPKHLKILGDGTQSKSYIHVDDVVSALRMIEKENLRGYDCYNVATLDHLTVTGIADLTVKLMGLSDVKYQYTGGDRGWKGDVPKVRLDSQKIRALGWNNRYSSTEAMTKALRSMYESKLEENG